MTKVLVVDDYDEHIDTLVGTAKTYGADARGERDGTRAIAICESWQPHLVIYDADLEGKHAWKFAYELTGLIYKQQADCGTAIHRPLLVALSAFGSVRQRRLCEECGFDAYATKPIELSQLLGWMQDASQRAWNV
jgi:two-component system, chemotaxis family, sensor kinase Cph1